MRTEFYVGENAIVVGEFLLNETEPTDPSQVYADVYPPSGAMYTETYPSSNLLKTSTGTFACTVPITEAGRWKTVFRSTGTAKGVGAASFVARNP